MFRVVVLLVLFLTCSARAGQLPLTTKEVSLMLRAGYSNNAVAQELTRRSFADALDPQKEDTLLKAGANPELINAIKSGTYTVSGRAAQRARQQAARQDQLDAKQDERLRQSGVAYQTQVVRQRGAVAAPSGGGGTLYNAVRGDLVHYANGAVAPAEDSPIAGKKFIALYFSAHWCGPCRKFTPELVSYYNRVAPQHPEFEVIFMSADRSAAEMEDYMREENMPWPAVDYQKLKSKAAIQHYAGSGIPCLVLLDAATGKVLSDSFAGSQYLGPQKVLKDLDAILAESAAATATAGAGRVAQFARP